MARLLNDTTIRRKAYNRVTKKTHGKKYINLFIHRHVIKCIYRKLYLHWNAGLFNYFVAPILQTLACDINSYKYDKHFN